MKQSQCKIQCCSTFLAEYPREHSNSAISAALHSFMSCIHSVDFIFLHFLALLRILLFLTQAFIVPRGYSHTHNKQWYSSQTAVLLLMSDSSFLHDCAETFLCLAVPMASCQTRTEVRELINQAFCNKLNCTPGSSASPVLLFLGSSKCLPLVN